MKKLLVILFLVMTSVGAFAQKDVSYTHKPLAAEGCKVTCSVLVKDNEKFLVVKVYSDRLKYSADPLLMMKTFEGDVIKLQGQCLESNSSTIGIMAGNMLLPYDMINAFAQFEISDEQIELLDKGICKVRLSTVPLMHEKEFKKDKIGKKLCKMFKEAISKVDDF